MNRQDFGEYADYTKQEVSTAKASGGRAVKDLPSSRRNDGYMYGTKLQHDRNFFQGDGGSGA